MKTLDRYILREFLAPLALIVLGIASLVALVGVVDTLPSFRDWKAPFHLIALYHLLKFPHLVMQVLPMGVMLATLIALGNLARSSELAAMRAGGVSPARIVAPILAAAMLISCLHGLASEFLVPFSTNQARYVQKVLIEKRTLDWDSPWREKMAKSGAGGRQFYLDRYDAQVGEMGGVLMLERRNGLTARRVDAARARYEDKAWVFYDGVERLFDGRGLEASARAFKRWPMPEIRELPRDFIVESNQREEDLLQMSAAQLMRTIAILRTTGQDTRKERACLHVRLAYPLSCLILGLLGAALPFLFPYGRRAMVGAAVGLLVTLSTGMLYLVFIQVGLSLGKGGVLPPLAGAWIANLAFSGVGLAALLRANR